ncbi:redoxin domain-containing protein [Lacibacter sediminis]|uniref:Redoxin domain-containing protein n=1 Tax=Lacibacter sediminis TaxID=2760713 RepID=A0A7G5XJT0_9BACT|nr:redoxin domain-containing protein [Lacibacter sediminis]QNA45733.1 redoxin domain-containing protein [Lacibacter sediminis]
MTIQIGQKAPDFSLFDTERKKVSLADFKGKNVLILFYPQAFSSTCTAELCTVRDDIARYNNANAEVLGISVDSVFTLKRYKEEQGYNFPLLSDFNKEVSAAYDSLYENWILEMKGVSKRSAFIVDKEGIIQYVELVETKDGVPDFEAINKKLESLN